MTFSNFFLDETICLGRRQQARRQLPHVPRRPSGLHRQGQRQRGPTVLRQFFEDDGIKAARQQQRLLLRLHVPLAHPR